MSNSTESPLSRRKPAARPKPTPVAARSRGTNKENQGPVSGSGPAQATAFSSTDDNANLTLQGLMERMARMEGQLRMFNHEDHTYLYLAELAKEQSENAQLTQTLDQERQNTVGDGIRDQETAINTNVNSSAARLAELEC